jgi:hypothetical protein
LKGQIRVAVREQVIYSQNKESVKRTEKPKALSDSEDDPDLDRTSMKLKRVP